jgi:hypothetical protein
VTAGETAPFAEDIMGYLHIDNLYKRQDILLFRECYALEKIHGTSAHVDWTAETVRFFSGAASHERFKGLFNEDLVSRFLMLGHPKVTVFGEAYGGGGAAGQGMRETYGEQLRFIAFDVKVGDSWLSVPQAEDVAKSLGIEFVHYEKISTHLADLDGQRDAYSVQAVRNGCGSGKIREGVVLRPLIELTKNNGDRIIVKHKRADFEERSTPQKVVDVEKLAVLAEADKIAEEWVTPMRLTHVLDKLSPDGLKLTMKDTPKVIKAMVEDVLREAAGEIVDSKDAQRAISKRAAELFKARIT